MTMFSEYIPYHTKHVMYIVDMLYTVLGVYPLKL